MAAVVLMCRWQDGAHVVLKLAEEPRGCLYVPWLMREKVPGDTKGSAIKNIRGRAAGVFPPGCPDAKEQTWQLIHPARALEMSPKGAFQLAMETLNNVVGLQVVGGCVGGRDPKKVVEF